MTIACQQPPSIFLCKLSFELGLDDEILWEIHHTSYRSLWQNCFDFFRCIFNVNHFLRVRVADSFERPPFLRLQYKVAKQKCE